MPKAFPRTLFSASALALAITSLIYAPGRGQASTNGDTSMNAKLKGFSREDLMRLRPILLRDLVPSLKLVYNDPNPSSADVEDAFLNCSFTPLRLGKLGRAVFVEWKGNSGLNVPMLDIYLATDRSYRRIVDAGGFGLRIVPTPDSMIPYLVFGGGGGVCANMYTLFAYREDKYEPIACDQDQRKTKGCREVTCDPAKPLPLFPAPWPAAGPSIENDGSASGPSAYFTGPTLTAKQILNEKP
jgi:hypothetical protein